MIVYSADTLQYLKETGLSASRVNSSMFDMAPDSLRVEETVECSFELTADRVSAVRKAWDGAIHGTSVFYGQSAYGSPAALFGGLMFRGLFDRLPNAHILFRHNRPRVIEHAFVGMIAKSVAMLDDPFALRRDIVGLADRHVVYGVRRTAEVVAFCDCCSRALRTCLGPEWTRDTAEAWKQFMSLFAVVMVSRIHAARSSPRHRRVPHRESLEA